MGGGWGDLQVEELGEVALALFGGVGGGEGGGREGGEEEEGGAHGFRVGGEGLGGEGSVDVTEN